MKDCEWTQLPDGRLYCQACDPSHKRPVREKARRNCRSDERKALRRCIEDCTEFEDGTCPHLDHVRFNARNPHRKWARRVLKYGCPHDKEET